MRPQRDRDSPWRGRSGAVSLARRRSPRSLTALVAALAVVGLTMPAAAAVQSSNPRASWGVPTAIPGLAALLVADGNAFVQAPELFCATPGNCTYFAYDLSSDTDPPEVGHLLYAVERGGVWTDASIAPGTAGFSNPGGEICPYQGDCVVWFDNASWQTVVVTESGGIWGSPQQLADTASAQLSLVSLVCPAPGNCTAIGSDETGRVVVVEQRHGTWQDPTALSGIPAIERPHGGANPTQLVCPAVGTCVVTGAVGNTVRGWPFVAEERAGVWSDAHTIPWVMTRNRNQAVIDDVACGAPGWCTLVGTYENGLQSGAPYRPQYLGFSQSELHGVWSTPIALTAASWNEWGTTQALVSCPDRASCSVAGLEGLGTSVAYVEHLVRGVPRGRKTYELYGSGVPEAVTLVGLSCPSAGACGILLSGYDPDAGYKEGARLVVANELSGSWGKPRALAGFPAYSNLGGPWDGSVACSTPTRCAATTDISSISDGQGPDYYLTS